MENLLVRRGDRTITVAVPPCDARRGGPCAAAWTAWGNLIPARGHARRSPVAQLAEHATVNRRVIGSSPIGGAKLLVSGLSGRFSAITCREDASQTHHLRPCGVVPTSLPSGVRRGQRVRPKVSEAARLASRPQGPHEVAGSA